MDNATSETIVVLCDSTACFLSYLEISRAIVF